MTPMLDKAATDELTSSDIPEALRELEALGAAGSRLHADFGPDGIAIMEDRMTIGSGRCVEDALILARRRIEREMEMVGAA